MKFWILIFALAGFARAQDASLVGSVVEQWESILPQATLTLTPSPSGAPLTATAGEGGQFSFAKVAPGSYDLTVSAAGFKTYTRHALVMAAGSNPVLEVRMEREKEDAATAISDTDFTGQFKLGRASLENGKLEDAASRFQTALKTEPTYIPAVLGLAKLTLRANRPDLAEQFARRILDLHAGDSAGTVLAAAADARLGREDEATILLDAHLKTHPFDTDAMLEAGLIRLQQKQYPEAEKFFHRAFEMDPQDLRALNGMAEVQLALQQPAKAVEIIARELEKAPERSDLRRQLAGVEFRAAQYDKALADYQALAAKSTDNPLQQAELDSRIAAVYREKGDYPRAIDNLKLARKSAPDNASYAVALGSVYELSGKNSEALTAYAEALQLEPGNALVLNNAAYLLVKKGNDRDIDEALRLVQLARRQLPDQPEINDTLALVYLKKGMVDSSSQIYQDLIEKDKSNPLYHYHYGMALAQRGDKAAALEQLHLALANKPAKQDEKEINDLIEKLAKAK